MYIKQQFSVCLHYFISFVSSFVFPSVNVESECVSVCDFFFFLLSLLTCFFTIIFFALSQYLLFFTFITIYNFHFILFLLCFHLAILLFLPLLLLCNMVVVVVVFWNWPSKQLATAKRFSTSCFKRFYTWTGKCGFHLETSKK